MGNYRITGVHKPDRDNPHERITHVQINGQLYREEDIIRSIKSGADSFYVQDPAKSERAYVGVVRPSDGRKPFLRTHADGDGGDNLLSLPEV